MNEILKAHSRFHSIKEEEVTCSEAVAIQRKGIASIFATSNSVRYRSETSFRSLTDRHSYSSIHLSSFIIFREKMRGKR